MAADALTPGSREVVPAAMTLVISGANDAYVASESMLWSLDYSG